MKKRVWTGKKRAIILTVIILFIASSIFINCNTGGGSSSDDADSEQTQYDHQLKTNISYIHGGTASGTIRVTREIDGKVFNGTINGNPMNLGKTKFQTERYTIELRGNNAIKRTFESVEINNNTLITTIVNKNDINWSWMRNQRMTPDDMNKVWEPTSIDVYFNPAPDGRTLTGDQKKYIRDAINDLKTWSNGYIKSVNFKNGNKIKGPAPPEGETWAFCDPETSGVANATYPRNGDRVKSNIILIQPNQPGDRCYSESLDAFIQNNQNLGTSTKLGPIFTFLLNRPRGRDNNYTVTDAGESQTGIDSFSTLQEHPQSATVVYESSGGMNIFDFIGPGSKIYNRVDILIEPEGKIFQEEQQNFDKNIER